MSSTNGTEKVITKPVNFWRLLRQAMVPGDYAIWHKMCEDARDTGWKQHHITAILWWAFFLNILIPFAIVVIIGNLLQLYYGT